ncbi:heat-shock protein Hsp20 [Niastella koreensis]|uniref:Heat shock protein Hsp20 n=2 Tax=Niastella koreensis TaxID=354356 RepID=G8TJ88_NIAKG|nr:Hsp20/alpha crystallin family protein [Niastella koreensis]AEV98621.1 heat shock protein Hsp20 [Niastella koreensis GR20-10]OQP52937.1 heat-shock protein Hsp20 [Niastella koreensis]
MSNITKSSSVSLPMLRDFFNISSFFDGNWMTRLESGFPAVNISEDEKEFNVDLAVPGFKKDDIKIKINDDILTISAENKTESEEEKNKEYTRREYSYSAFTRSFRLPDNIDSGHIDAHFEDGILKIKLPKTDMQLKSSKEISIN